MTENVEKKNNEEHNIKEFEKKYDFKEYEPLIENFWKENNVNNENFDKIIKEIKEEKNKKDKEKILNEIKKKVFVIDTPPPTVSGSGMHMGHAFSYSQIDFIARYQRMKGKVVYFPFGFDDNGLPTEKFVEKKFKVKAKDMDRKEFRELCYKAIKETEQEFYKFWDRMGLSADFRNAYSTISKEVIKLSQESFLELYEQGREYRKESPVTWCPECNTAISQVEMEDKEIESTFNDIIFKIDDNGKEKDLIIATTRPELLPACVAIFVNPDDERYKDIVGKEAKVPLFNFKVKILADERAQKDKGTGAVMCCTFGDQTDVEWYKAYKLPLKEAIDEEGRMTEIAGKYKGMKSLDARKAIIEDLKKNNLLVRQKKIKHVVNVHERCKTPIEILNRPQWFVKYLDLKDKFLEIGDKLNWHPQHMKNRYDNWVKGLQWDWCISRQRYFGIPIPVWYCKDCGEVIPAKKEQLPVDPLVDKPPVDKCPKCGSKNIVPETDVLDTWATSSLTPFIISKWKEDEDFFKVFFPSTLRPQAHDIISFWLFNTIVKTYLHEKEIPWKDVMISGYVLAPDGNKMSKSLGNVVDPWELVKTYSADAVRFWAASSKLGEDLPLQDKEMINAKKLFNKMWNASKFIKMNIEKLQSVKDGEKDVPFLNEWLLTKLSKVITEATEGFDNYNYFRTKSASEKFFKQMLCDNYLEFIKPVVWNPEEYNEGSKKKIILTLKKALNISLRLFAPIIPHITEAIYQKMFDGKSVHLEKWPTTEEIKEYYDEDSELVGDTFMAIISEVRKYKAQKQMSLKTEIEKAIVTIPETSSRVMELKHLIQSLTHIKELEIKMGKELKVEI